MNGAPLITFGIPAYNRPAMLAEALAGLAAQEGDFDFEVVVCDDGGLAETRRVVETFSGRPIRFYLNSPRLGPVANWNECLQQARGRWVTILHEDDLLFPWYLKLTVPHLRDGLSAVCPRTVQGAAPQPVPKPSSRPRLRSYPPAYFMKSGITPFPGVLFPRELGLELGGFDERWGPLADHDFWYRLGCAGEIKIIRAVGAFYRLNTGQWTNSAWPRMLRLMHLLRLRIAREQFHRAPRQGRWLARFFTRRAALSYQQRFPQRPAVLDRVLRFKKIPFSSLPSGWVWAWLKLTAKR